MKTVLITGASSGIGKALVQYYANANYQVFAFGRDTARLEQLKQLNTNITAVSCDLTDLSQLQQVSTTLPMFDLIILNAGNCEYIDDPVNFDAALFQRVMAANVQSVANCLSVWLKKIKPYGRVAINSSSAQFLPLPRAEAYGASKAALTYLARTLRIDLQPHNIFVSVIHPGFVATPLTAKNTFAMPSILTTEQAALAIVKGLNKGKDEINFPPVFIAIMKFLAFLPRPLWRKLALRML
ncbi:SDR family NAD(P)-dependent oxidoreductase [Pseudoalteromonas tunicata]|uniref:SDR family NAD(P)-dependent oxidoreductase n=1 Tax=Pseudoalteromonas tunicata TaxID=314281 RepID=UPI00273E3EA5|nr:SDR family NAD(P)-dependent oxidoreductase [Pseudoalteromonas tunicata]MDP4984789.1 SDR family NAD(P)-dependent oxidoreductase [Pseudoalteromonas tunicata]